MTYYGRDDWGARPRRGTPTPLAEHRVSGIALHWPGVSKPTPIRGVENVSRWLRSWQDYHMDTKGWSDIAYQEAVDQEGNAYKLRGLATQSGANGNLDLNQRFGALLLVMVPGEQPTQALITTVRRRIELFRELFPDAKSIVGHGQIRPGGSTCPGPIILDHIRRGAFEPVRITHVTPNWDDIFVSSEKILANPNAPTGDKADAATIRELAIKHSTKY